MGTEVAQGPLGNLLNMSHGTRATTLTPGSGDLVTGAPWEDPHRARWAKQCLRNMKVFSLEKK